MMDDIRFPYANQMTPEHKAALTRLMNRQDFRASRRPIWLPLTQQGEDRAATSKYGGIPWLSQSESWPACNHCHRAMHLFLQINLQEPPADVGGRFGQGMIQFFYCKRRDCVEDCGGKLPPDDMSVVRLVDLDAPGRPGSHDEGPEDLLPAVLIVDWKKQIDYHPDPNELDALRIELTQEERDLFEGWGLLETGDKLAGWPAWIQASEPMLCRTCGQEMQHVFQFEPHIHLNYSFGQEFFARPVDVGCGWLFQCPEHKGQLAFTWQCH
jgi:hypothetical protein